MFLQSEQLSKLFEWCDGPLVQAMKDGAVLLVDEISLADDSVLERLNSVLEPERTLLLAEKGGGPLDSSEYVDILVAHQDFRIIGTMNPGGDFGKKEVSTAGICRPAARIEFEICNAFARSLFKALSG